MFTKKQNRLFFLLAAVFVVLFLFLRIYRLPERMIFYSDQGYLLGLVRDVWNEKRITALGPMFLSIETEGRSVFTGSAYTYLTLALALITRWNPLSMSALIPFFQFIAVGLAAIAIGKRIGRTWGMLFFMAAATFPFFVYYSNFIWNPGYGLILSFLSIYLIERILVKQKPGLFVLLGVLTGLTLELHYLYWLSIPFFVLYVFFKFKIRNLAIFLLGTFIGNAPLFLFELRNNFYNLRTIFYILLNYGKRTGEFHLPQHYYVIFLPFVLYILISVAGKLKRNKNFLIGVIIGFILLFLGISSRTAIYALPYGMLGYWRYNDQLKVVDIIQSQNEEYYNVASIFYPDTREYAIRFLLERSGQKIMPVDAYSRTNILYLLSSEEEPLKHDVWEVNTMKPATVVASWTINDTVSLYKVVRDTKK
jgi:hypothetical protein